MIKLSKRLQKIADYINKEDKVVDIGCDHGYLDIYLKSIGIKDILATDEKMNALQQAINNFKLYNVDINYVVSDGIKNVDIDNYDTLVIAGMGAYTIIKILQDINNFNNIKKLIIQSNNHLELIREFLNKNGYYLEDEEVVYEYKYYVVMKFIRSDKKINEDIIKYGIIKKKNINYYRSVINKYLEILNLVKKDSIKYNYINKLINGYQNIIERIEEK